RRADPPRPAPPRRAGRRRRARAGRVRAGARAAAGGWGGGLPAGGERLRSASDGGGAGGLVAPGGVVSERRDAGEAGARGCEGRTMEEGARAMDGQGATAFGDLLRRYRDGAGLTQEELAERTGLIAMAISLLERGERRRPQAYTVQKLAEALGLKPGDRAQFEAAARRSGSAGPEAAPGIPPHNLPLQLTSFIGTEQKLAQVKQL